MPASEFSDVFVSYRRKDVEFVKRLVDDLQQEGKEVWVDWEDIPPGVEGFADEIKRGLEGADTFLAVLTPDYLDSEYCVDMELGYAVQMNKKIIPIVLKKFDGYEIPKGIGHINWIYFTPHAGQENSYEEAFPKIIDVMHTDLEHVRLHKRFLLRSVEWDNNNKTNSFLLNGDEISDAENWLTSAIGKEPLPTELHKEYIARSRRVANQRQRMLLAGVTVALVVSVILSILSLIGFNNTRIAEATAVANFNVASTAQIDAENNYQQALTAESRAESNLEQAQTAESQANENFNVASTAQFEAERNESRALSAEATAVQRAVEADVRLLANRLDDIARGDPFLAYRLGLGLLEVDDLPLRSKGAIIELFLSTGALKYFDYDIYDLQTSHDNRYVYLVVDTVDIIQIDALTGEIVNTFDEHDGWVMEFALSPDNRTLVSIDDWSILYIWDVETGELLTRSDISGFLDYTVGLAVLADSSTAIVASEEGGIYGFSLDTGEYIGELPQQVDGGIQYMQLSPLNYYIVTIDFEGQASIWDFNAGEIVYIFDGTFDVYDPRFEFVQNESILVAGVTTDGEGFVFDMNELESIATIHEVFDFDISPSESEIVVTTWFGDVLFATLEGDETDIYTGVSAYRVRYAPDHQHLLIINYDGQIRLIDMFTGSVVRELSGQNTYTEYLHFLNDSTILTSSYSQQIIWSLDNQEIIQSVSSSPYSMALLPDGKTGIQITDFGELVHIDLVTHEQIGLLGSVSEIDIIGGVSPDGKYVVTIDGDGVLSVWDIEARAFVESLFGGYIGADVRVAFSANSDYLVMITSVGELALWQLSTLMSVKKLELMIDSPASVALSRGADVAYIGVWDGKIYAIDLQTGDILQEFSGHRSAAVALDLSVDEQSMISGGEDNSLILWDLNTGQPINRFEGHYGSITDVEFFPDGQTLLSSSSDDRMIQWDIESGEAIRIFEDHTNDVVSIDISADGVTALSTSWDYTAKYWRLWFPNEDLALWALDNLQIEPLSCDERDFYELPNRCE